MTKEKEIKYDNRFNDHLYTRLYDRLYTRLDTHLETHLRNRLYDHLHTLLKEKEIIWSEYISYYLYDWAGFYDYAQYIGVDFDKKEFKEFTDILLNLPITVFLGDTFIFILEKPKVNFENEKLHSEIEPAITWSDGNGFYFLNDIYMEKKMFNNIINKKLTAQEALTLKNIDYRSLALKYLGWDKVIKELDAKKISQDEYGELYEIDLKDDRFPAKFFKAIDPSTGDPIFERVRPECTTPKESQMLHYRLDIIQADYSDYERT